VSIDTLPAVPLEDAPVWMMIDPVVPVAAPVLRARPAVPPWIVVILVELVEPTVVVSTAPVEVLMLTVSASAAVPTAPT
jgi:hypothetical protein